LKDSNKYFMIGILLLVGTFSIPITIYPICWDCCANFDIYGTERWILMGIMGTGAFSSLIYSAYLEGKEDKNEQLQSGSP